MSKFVRAALPVVVLALATLPAVPPATAQSEGSESATTAHTTANVRLTVRVCQLDNGKRKVVKSYNLVVAAGGSGSQLLSGARVPIPTTADDGSSEKSFVYQNVGFSIQVEALIVEAGKIQVIASIEDSRIRDGSGDAPPTIETRQLSVNAILSDGVPLEVTRVDGVTEQSGFVEIEATILR